MDVEGVTQMHKQIHDRGRDICMYSVIYYRKFISIDRNDYFCAFGIQQNMNSTFLVTSIPIWKIQNQLNINRIEWPRDDWKRLKRTHIVYICIFINYLSHRKFQLYFSKK